MDRAALSPLLRSFERHLRAENRSDRTVASYLVALRQAEAFLAARGIGLAEQSLRGMTGVELLCQAHQLHPAAKRAAGPLRGRGRQHRRVAGDGA